jgi:hypothetical protein
MNTKRVIAFCILVAAAFSAPARALPNPAPDTYSDDDFTQLFTAAGSTTFEVSNPLDGAFGFFYLQGTDPFVPIFLPGDGPSSSAFVDFVQGTIVDQVTQTPRNFQVQPGPIGFYFFFPGAGDGAPNVFLATLDALNPSGLDLVGTFPALDNPTTYLIVPYLPLESGPVPFAVTAVTDVTPAAIPEPSTVVYLIAGIGLLLSLSRRSRIGARRSN